MNLLGLGGKDSDKESEKKAPAGGGDANESVAGSDAGEDGNGAKVGNMPEGDYIIHVLII